MEIRLTNVPFFGTFLTLFRIASAEEVEKHKDFLAGLAKGETVHYSHGSEQGLFPHVLSIKGTVTVINYEQKPRDRLTVRIPCTGGIFFIENSEGSGDVLDDSVSQRLLCQYLLETDWKKAP